MTTLDVSRFSPLEQQLLSERPLTEFEQSLDLRQVARLRALDYSARQGQITAEEAARESLATIPTEQQATILTDGKMDVIAAQRRGVPDLVLRGIGLPQETIERGKEILRSEADQIAAEAQQAEVVASTEATTAATTPPPSAGEPELAVLQELRANEQTELTNFFRFVRDIPNTELLASSTGPTANLEQEQQLMTARLALRRGEVVRELGNRRQYFQAQVEGLGPILANRLRRVSRSVARGDPPDIIARHQENADDIQRALVQAQQELAAFDRFSQNVLPAFDDATQVAFSRLQERVTGTGGSTEPFTGPAPSLSVGQVLQLDQGTRELYGISEPPEAEFEELPAEVITTETPLDQLDIIEAERAAEAERRLGPEAQRRNEAMRQLQELQVATPDGRVDIQATITLGRRDLLTDAGFTGQAIDASLAEYQRLRNLGLQLDKFQVIQQPIAALTERQRRAEEIDTVVSQIDQQIDQVQRNIDIQTADIARPAPDQLLPWETAIDQLNTQRTSLLRDKEIIERWGEPLRGPAGVEAPGFQATLPPDLQSIQQRAQERLQFINVAAAQTPSVKAIPAYQSVVRRLDLINLASEAVESGAWTPDQARTFIDRLPVEINQADWQKARLEAANYVLIRSAGLGPLGIPLAGAATASIWDLRTPGERALDVGLLLASAVPSAATFHAAGRNIGATQGVLPRLAATTREATNLEFQGIQALVQHPARTTADMVKQGLINPLEAGYTAVRSQVPIGTAQGQRLLGLERQTHTLRLASAERFADNIGVIHMPQGLLDDVEAGIISSVAVKDAVTDSTLSVMQQGIAKEVPILTKSGTPSEYAVKVEGSELAAATKRGFAFSGTPDGRIGMLPEGLKVDEGLLWFSPDPHSRFTIATSSGRPIQWTPEQLARFEAAGLGEPIPTIYVFSGDNLLSQLQGSAKLPGIKGDVPADTPGAIPKLYNGSAEIEAVAPEGLETGPAVQRFFRRDNGGNRVQVLVFGEPLSRLDIAKLNIRAPIAVGKTIAAPPGEFKYVGPRTTAKGKIRAREARQTARPRALDDRTALEVRANRLVAESEALRAAGDIDGAYSTALEAALTRQAINQLFSARAADLIEAIEGRGTYAETATYPIGAPPSRGVVSGAEVRPSPRMGELVAPAGRRGVGDVERPLVELRTFASRMEAPARAAGRESVVYGPRARGTAEEVRARIIAPDRRIPAEVDTTRPIVPEPERPFIPEPERPVVPEPERAITVEPGRPVVPELPRLIVPVPPRPFIPELPRITTPEPPRSPPPTIGLPDRPSRKKKPAAPHTEIAAFNTGVTDLEVNLVTGERTWHKDLPEVPEVPARQSHTVLKRGKRKGKPRNFPMGSASVTITEGDVDFKGRKGANKKRRAYNEPL